jgi:hypothetical protein
MKCAMNPDRSDMLEQMRTHHPAYFDTPALDMTRSALFQGAAANHLDCRFLQRAWPLADVVTVNADQIAGIDCRAG